MFRTIVFKTYIICFLCSCSDISKISRTAVKTEEYCHSETFAPRCDRNEAIVIHDASYGRKKFGRCLSDEEEPNESNFDDIRFIGCHSDVRNLVMPTCFGRQECSLRIAEIKAATPCYKYLKLYLEVSHSCVAIAQPNSQCQMSVNHLIQHLGVPQTGTSSCGSVKKPWIIETLVGQRLIVRGLMFEGGSLEKEPSKCWNLGHIIDKYGESLKVPICLKFDNLETHIYKSKSNQIEVYLTEESRGDYLLSVEATGCSDLIPPSDAWLKRTENEATIGCYSTRLRWKLKCVGQRWIGVIGNCSYGQVIATIAEIEGVKMKIDQKSSIFVIVVSGLVLSLLIGCLGVICLKRIHVNNKLKSTNKFVDVSLQMIQPKYSIDFKEHLNSAAPVMEFQDQNTEQYFELDRDIRNKDLN